MNKLPLIFHSASNMHLLAESIVLYLNNNSYKTSVEKDPKYHLGDCFADGITIEFTKDEELCQINLFWRYDLEAAESEPYIPYAIPCFADGKDDIIPDEPGNATLFEMFDI